MEGDAIVYEPIIETGMALPDALTKVCKVSRAHCKLSRGAKESSRKIRDGEAVLILLAKDSEPTISQSITELAKQKAVPVMLVESKEELGIITGQEKVNSEGKKSHRNCCVAVIQDFCEPTLEKAFVESAMASGLSL